MCSVANEPDRGIKIVVAGRDGVDQEEPGHAPQPGDMHMVTQGVDALVIGGPIEHLGRLAQRPATVTFPLVRGCGEQVSSRVGDPGGLGRISGGAQRSRRVPGDLLRPLPNHATVVSTTSLGHGTLAFTGVPPSHALVAAESA